VRDHAGRFLSGQSGNPNGRPKKKRLPPPGRRGHDPLTVAQALAQLVTGSTPAEVAAAVGVDKKTVVSWWQRYGELLCGDELRVIAAGVKAAGFDFGAIAAEEQRRRNAAMAGLRRLRHVAETSWETGSIGAAVRALEAELWRANITLEEYGRQLEALEAQLTEQADG
jgi:hypothetical protein